MRCALIQYIYCSVLVVPIWQTRKRCWKKNALFERTIDMYLRFEINRSFFFDRDVNDVAFTTRLYWWKDVTFYHDLMFLNPKKILMTFEEMRFQAKKRPAFRCQTKGLLHEINKICSVCHKKNNICFFYFYLPIRV